MWGGKFKWDDLKGGTHIAVFTRDIEGNPFEKGFSLDNYI